LVVVVVVCLMVVLMPQRSIGQLTDTLKITPCPNRAGGSVLIVRYGLLPTANFTALDVINYIGIGLFPTYRPLRGFVETSFSYFDESTMFGFGTFIPVPFDYIGRWMEANQIESQVDRNAQPGNYTFYKSNCNNRGLEGRTLYIRLFKLLPNASLPVEKALEIIRSIEEATVTSQPGFRIYAGMKLAQGFPTDPEGAILTIYDYQDQYDAVQAIVRAQVASSAAFNQVTTIYNHVGTVSAHFFRAARRGANLVPPL